MYIIMLKLSAHPPHSVLVPCINIEPGPSHHAADAYKMEIGVNPINLLLEEVSSFDMTQKIYRPTTIKPKLLKVLTGSLKAPSLTLSHHLDASPIRLVSDELINPDKPRT